MQSLTPSSRRNKNWKINNNKFQKLKIFPSLLVSGCLSPTFPHTCTKFDTSLTCLQHRYLWSGPKKLLFIHLPLWSGYVHRKKKKVRHYEVKYRGTSGCWNSNNFLNKHLPKYLLTSLKSLMIIFSKYILTYSINLVINPVFSNLF